MICVSFNLILFHYAQETKKRFDEIPELDPIKDMNIQSTQLKKSVDNLQALEKKLRSMPLHTSPHKAELCEKYAEKFKVCNGSVILAV